MPPGQDHHRPRGNPPQFPRPRSSPYQELTIQAHSVSNSCSGLRMAILAFGDQSPPVGQDADTWHSEQGGK